MSRQKSKFSGRITKRVAESTVVDLVESNTRGVIRVIMDRGQRVGLMYGSGINSHCYVTWDAEDFPEFIADMERRFPENKEPFPADKIDAIVKAHGGSIEQVSIRLGFGGRILREFRGGRIPSMVAKRILWEAYDRAKNKNADSVAPLDTVPEDVG